MFFTGDKLQKLHDALEDVDKGTDFEGRGGEDSSHPRRNRKRFFLGEIVQFLPLKTGFLWTMEKTRGGRRMLSLGPMQFKGHEARCGTS